MELYHLTQVATVPKWTITHTAIYFECSLGLVSENLRLAHTIHTHPSIIECATREDALKQMRKYGTLQQSKVAKA